VNVLASRRRLFVLTFARDQSTFTKIVFDSLSPKALNVRDFRPKLWAAAATSKCVSSEANLLMTV
jgi:hypothetical protein